MNKEILYICYALKMKNKIKMLNFIKEIKLDNEEYEDIPVIDKTIEGLTDKSIDNTSYEIRYNKIIMAELLKGNINEQTIYKLIK